MPVAAYIGCYDGPLACARQCFAREIALAASATSAEVAHRCAVECGVGFEPSQPGTGREATCWMRDAFIGLVDCLAALTDVAEPDADGGVAPEACASACFEGWR